MQNPSVSFNDIVGTAVTLKTDADDEEEVPEREAEQIAETRTARPAEGGISSEEQKRLYTPDDIDF